VASPWGKAMRSDWLGKVRRALKKPPGFLVRRALHELMTEADCFLAAPRARRFDENALLRTAGAPNLASLWQQLAERPYLAHTAPVEPALFERACPGEQQRLLAAAEEAALRRVNLLGSGLIDLGSPTHWSRDYKSGCSWPPGFAPRMKYVRPEQGGDVKMPWEMSRLQWLLPAGQAYLLTGEERYAAAARDVLEDWIAANPYAGSVNWACTMEVALRILSWTWLFHVFHRSAAWSEPGFQGRFLRALFLHGDYTERYLERSDVNGNHFTADAAGLVFAGLFFGSAATPQRWQRLGWDLLCAELPRQVLSDGVDFEASVAYHRLVQELFLLPALYREKQGLPVPAAYRERLIAMARFTAAYSRVDGTVPLVGDADDARALPLGTQSINDHRYLPHITGAAWNVEELRRGFSGPRGEVFWLLGPEAAERLGATNAPGATSVAFPQGGFYVLRNEQDHIFVDCGPVGLAGRGGHGHNDCLSFEAALQNVHLVTDCGSYVYTASFEERNHFRSTAYHNTPQIDGEEINRFIHPNNLWNLHNDAQPEVRLWQMGPEQGRFRGAHSGYRRLPSPITPVRTLILDHGRHALIVHDAFEGEGEHELAVPLHLAPGVSVVGVEEGKLQLRAVQRVFILLWGPCQDWTLEIGSGRSSPSYGVAVPIIRLCWHRRHFAKSTLLVCLAGEDNLPPDPLPWARGLVDQTS
jgi:uncharacterized heparinase superfamily protein